MNACYLFQSQMTMTDAASWACKWENYTKLFTAIPNKHFRSHSIPMKLKHSHGNSNGAYWNSQHSLTSKQKGATCDVHLTAYSKCRQCCNLHNKTTPKKTGISRKRPAIFHISSLSSSQMIIRGFVAKFCLLHYLPLLLVQN